MPLYHKIRISIENVFDATQELDRFVEALRGSGILPLSDRVAWDIRLTALNDLRQEPAESRLDDANKRRLLTRNYPRFMWRMEASSNGAPLF